MTQDFKDRTPLQRLLWLGGMAKAAGGKTVEETASGNPLTFITDVSKPLKSLLIPFTPQQEGTGDPSPENIRPIVAWNGLKVNHSEENLIDVSGFPSKSSGGITYTNNGDGSITLNGVCTAFNPQAIALSVNLPAGKYYLTVNNDKAKTGTGDLYIGMNDINGADYWASLGSINAKATINASAPLRRMFINIFVGAELDNVTIKPMLVSGEGYADFKPYTGEKHDISFPSAVYGGTLDVVSGVLTVKWAVKIFTGAQGEVWTLTLTSSNRYRAVFYKHDFENVPKNNSIMIANYLVNSTGGASGNGWFGSTGNFLCYVFDGITTESNWRAYLAEHPLVIAYELATPQQVQLTPEQITALVGDNTIWSDTNGENTVVYLKKS